MTPIPSAEAMRELAKSKVSIDERTTKWLYTTCVKAICERADDGYLSAVIPLLPNLNPELIIQALSDKGYAASVTSTPDWRWQNYRLIVSWKEEK
nr:MAG TPA: hypothetical protein [Caudoviricetes sp.]